MCIHPNPGPPVMDANEVSQEHAPAKAMQQNSRFCFVSVGGLSNAYDALGYLRGLGLGTSSTNFHYGRNQSWIS